MRDFTTRHLGGALLALALGATAAPALADTTLTYVSFGGSLQAAEEKAWLEPFAAAHPGVEIVYDFIDYAKLKAMVESGNVTWDVVTTGNDFGLDNDAALLEPIDCSIVPCDKLQPNRFPTTGYRVPQSTSGLAIGYNTTLMPAGKAPQGWVDFFDTKAFPGKRVMMGDTSSFPLEQALLGDGVPADQLYPLDIKRALAKLDSLGDDLIVTPSYQGCAEMVASGEAVMGGCWTGRLLAMADAGQPVAMQWNQGIISPGYWAVPKGAPNKDLAMQFIAWAVSGDHNGDLAKFIPYGPANVDALPKVDPALAPKLQSSYLDVSVFPDDIWYDQHRAEVATAFAEWLAGVK